MTSNLGARGYYATIVRFTSIDPLAENTPWQSPYSYASNNFIAEIDWMGLGGYNAYNNDLFITPHLTIVDESGNIIVQVVNEDYTVYMKKEDSDALIIVGYEIRVENTIIGYAGVDINNFTIYSSKNYDQLYGETMIGGLYSGTESRARKWGGFNDLGVFMKYGFGKSNFLIYDIIVDF